MIENVKEDIFDWLLKMPDGERKTRIWEIGLLTGWRKYPDGSYGPPNFERGLLLDRIVEIIQPLTALEIGTGRGLGSISLASAAEVYGIPLQITTIDMISPDSKQFWPIRHDKMDKTVNASRTEIWSEHFGENINNRIEQLTGLTNKILPHLLKSGKKYDFIFIDAGHDTYSVIHDLSFASKILKPNGVILMDDFAPEEEYGIGTCLALPHARRMFQKCDVFPTEGLVYGGAENSMYPRAMALFQGLKSDFKIHSNRLIWWRLVDRIIKMSYHIRRLFPVH